MSSDSHDAAGRIRKQGDLIIDHVVTSGTFALDGGEWDVDNNIWVFGDENEVIVVDAAHSAAPIIDAVAGRRVKAIVCTHAHNDHITVAPELSTMLDAPILLHPGDEMLWDETHHGVEHETMHDGQVFHIAGTDMQVLNIPGHSARSVMSRSGSVSTP